MPLYQACQAMGPTDLWDTDESPGCLQGIMLWKKMTVLLQYPIDVKLRGNSLNKHINHYINARFCIIMSICLLYLQWTPPRCILQPCVPIPLGIIITWGQLSHGCVCAGIERFLFTKHENVFLLYSQNNWVCVSCVSCWQLPVYDEESPECFSNPPEALTNQVARWP